jgi:hypothetical protein
VLLAFCAAQILAQIPITPGGLGFVEAGLTGTLTLIGVPAGSAVLATFTYGERGSSTTVVLFGDSHAMQYFPALERIAARRRWRLVNLTKGGCPPARVRALYPLTPRMNPVCDVARVRAAAHRAGRAPRARHRRIVGSLHGRRRRPAPARQGREHARARDRLRAHARAAARRLGARHGAHRCAAAGA